MPEAAIVLMEYDLDFALIRLGVKFGDEYAAVCQ